MSSFGVLSILSAMQVAANKREQSSPLNVESPLFGAALLEWIVTHFSLFRFLLLCPPDPICLSLFSFVSFKIYWLESKKINRLKKETESKREYSLLLFLSD